MTFDEAATVFRDSRALSILDPDHSETEDRWITLGISEKGKRHRSPYFPRRR